MRVHCSLQRCGALWTGTRQGSRLCNASVGAPCTAPRCRATNWQRVQSVQRHLSVSLYRIKEPVRPRGARKHAVPVPCRWTAVDAWSSRRRSDAAGFCYVHCQKGKKRVTEPLEVKRYRMYVCMYSTVGPGECQHWAFIAPRQVSSFYANFRPCSWRTGDRKLAGRVMGVFRLNVVYL